MKYNYLYMLATAATLFFVSGCSSSSAIDDIVKEPEVVEPEPERSFVHTHSVSGATPRYEGMKHATTSKSKYYVTRVFDFLPSYGQFVNKHPKFEKGNTYRNLVAKAEKALAQPVGGLISLGGFGGFIVVGFDHTIENKPGFMDFRVLGNAFVNKNPETGKDSGSSEPGIILVSYDANGNGEPDDEWFEIRGSEYSNTKKGYKLIIHAPEVGKAPVLDNEELYLSDVEYMKWEDNEGASGYKPQLKVHNQSYFPSWIPADVMSFEGSLLPNVATNLGTISDQSWVNKTFDFGYADNYSNSDDRSAIDIDWAVNSKGERVHLPGVDFIKIYTGVNQQSGWLGEISTEVTGVHDLHVKGEVIKTIKVNF